MKIYIVQQEIVLSWNQLARKRVFGLPLFNDGDFVPVSCDVEQTTFHQL